MSLNDSLAKFKPYKIGIKYGKALRDKPWESRKRRFVKKIFLKVVAPVLAATFIAASVCVTGALLSTVPIIGVGTYVGGVGSVAPFIMPAVWASVNTLLGFSYAAYLMGMSKSGLEKREAYPGGEPPTITNPAGAPTITNPAGAPTITNPAGAPTITNPAGAPTTASPGDGEEYPRIIPEMNTTASLDDGGAYPRITPNGGGFPSTSENVIFDTKGITLNQDEEKGVEIINASKKDFDQDVAIKMVMLAIRNGGKKITLNGTDEHNKEFWLAIKTINLEKKIEFDRKKDNKEISQEVVYVPITAKDFFVDKNDKVYGRWKEVEASLINNGTGSFASPVISRFTEKTGIPSQMRTQGSGQKAPTLM